LIYAEDFAGPYSDQYSARFGGDSSHPWRRWSPANVPYAEFGVAGGSYYVRENPGIVNNNVLDSGRRIEQGVYNNMDGIIHLPRSRNLTIGFLVQFGGTRSPWTVPIEFRSYHDNSDSYIVNFTVTLSISSADSRQKANVYFQTGGSGYPEISDEVVCYDFTQPIWLWVQCDMPSTMPTAENGTCRIWLNNDLVITKEDIITGRVDDWAAQPLYGYNNGVYFYWSDADDLYSVVAVNEKLGYLDSALGDINVSGLLPEVAEVSQWFSHKDGLNLETEPVDVMKDNLHTDEAQIHTKAHLRADDHLVQSIFGHETPFSEDAHIMAVSHRIVHRKHNIGGSAVNLRVEPMIHISGRDPSIDRSAGQVSTTNIKTIVANYSIPYAGAYWSKELLELTKFGFAYFDAARPTQVDEQVDLLGEYDVENLDDGIEMGSLAQDDDYLLGGTIRTHILDDGMDLDIEAIDGDTV
jgi:hypothetical protein